jgi:uncharacterized protein (UPF0335 family)
VTDIVNATTSDEARRLTERIRLVAANVAENVQKLRELVTEARESNAHEVLGYASWTAYLKDVFGDEPLRLARDVRQELVAELSAQGMSTRAIAPIVGVSQKTVDRDVRGESNDSPDLPPRADDWVVSDKFFCDSCGAEFGTDRLNETTTGKYCNECQDNRVLADLSNGEIVPTVTEVTETHTVKTVTGLDGKTYQQTQPRKQNRRALTDTARDAGWELRKAVERIERIREDDRYSRNKEEVATHLRSHLTYVIESCQGLLDDLNQ